MMPIRLAALLFAAAVAAPAPAAAAEWTVDPAKSTLGFQGTQGGTSFTGRFSRWQAVIQFDPANPAGGHALVTVDMASAGTGQADKDQALPAADWFDTKDYPQARFEASTFRSLGGNRYEAVGSLTLRGVKKDVVLPFLFEQHGGAAHASGTLDLLRTDYGVGQGAWSSGQVVGLAVTVTLDIIASQQP